MIEESLPPAHAELNHMHACYAAIRDHLGGKPELVEEATVVLRDLMTWRIPSARDWGNEAVRDEFRAMQKSALALLSRIKEQSNG